MSSSNTERRSDSFSLKILTPPLRLSLFTAFVLSLSGLAWSFLARIPMQTRGTAVFVPATGLSAIYAETSGTLILYDPRKSAPSWVPLARGLLRSTQLDRFDHDLITVAQNLTNTGVGPILTDPALINSVTNTFAIPQGYLIARIIDPVMLAKVKQSLEDYQVTKHNNSMKSRVLNSQIQTYSSELSAQSNYLTGMLTLRSRQFVSESTILQQQATIANLKNQINTVRAQLLQNASDTDQKLTALYSSVVEYVAKGMYFAETDGWLNTVLSQTYNYIPSGSQIAITSPFGLKNPDTIPVVFSNKDAATVRAGQKASLQLITLDTISDNTRLVGRVSMMNTFPSDSDSLKAIVGSKPMADLLTSQYVSPTAGMIKLDRDRDGNYVTTIPDKTSFFKSVQPQDSFQVLVTTSYVRPIELVLPTLQRVLGLRPIPPKPEITPKPQK